MVQAYHFRASWQLFPEKCNLPVWVYARSGNYKIVGSTPQIGHIDHLYEKKDDTHMLSLVSPQDGVAPGLSNNLFLP